MLYPTATATTTTTTTPLQLQITQKWTICAKTCSRKPILNVLFAMLMFELLMRCWSTTPFLASPRNRALPYLLLVACETLVTRLLYCANASSTHVAYRSPLFRPFISMVTDSKGYPFSMECWLDNLIWRNNASLFFSFRSRSYKEEQKAVIVTIEQTCLFILGIESIENWSWIHSFVL